MGAPTISEQLANVDTSQLLWFKNRLNQLNRRRRWNTPQARVMKAIFHDGYKRVFIRKGRKAGGTEAISYVPVRIAGLFENVAAYIIGPTHSHQREIIWANQRLQKMVPFQWEWKPNEKDTRLIFPDNNSFIKVHGADDYRKLDGIEGDVFVFDELRDHDPRAYDNCYPNIAARDAIWIVCGKPPKNKDNFYYTLEQEIRDDPDWFFIHWSIWDNAEFLPGGREWIENEKKKYYARGDWDEWQVQYEAKYCFGGKQQVLPHFDSTPYPHGHVAPYEVIENHISQDKRKLRWFTVIDPGFATCFAVLFCCINDYTGHIFVLDEIYETRRHELAIHKIWDRVKRKEWELYPGGKWRRIYDSAAPAFPQEVRSRFGNSWHFQPTKKQEGDEDTYFRMLNTAFYLNNILIASRCKGLIKEAENYETDVNNGYPDKNNHQLDNLRYLLKMSNYKLIDKPEDIIVVPAYENVVTLEEGIAEMESRNDWVSAILNQDLSIPIVDDDFF